MFCFQVLGTSVRFSGLVASFSVASALFTIIFKFLDASFSSLGFFVFEFYVHHFPILGDLFSSLRYLSFSSSQCY